MNLVIFTVTSWLFNTFPPKYLLLCQIKEHVVEFVVLIGIFSLSVVFERSLMLTKAAVFF